MLKAIFSLLKLDLIFFKIDIVSPAVGGTGSLVGRGTAVRILAEDQILLCVCAWRRS